MSLPTTPTLPPSKPGHSTEPMPFALPAERDAALDGAADNTGFFRHLHTPRVAFGKPFTLQQVVFGLLLVFCLTPWASPPLALALGLVLAQTVGNPFGIQTKQATAKLLQFSVIGLGFGMNAHAAVQAGKEGIVFTVGSFLARCCWATSWASGWGWGGAWCTSFRAALPFAGGRPLRPLGR